MKLFCKFLLAAVLAAGLVSCASAGKARKKGFEAALGTGLWALESFSLGGAENYLNRDEPMLKSGEYTIEILRTENAAVDEYLLAGKGAPNRYRTTVSVDAHGRIRVMPVIATLMMAFAEPQILKERQYMTFIENMRSFEITGGDGKPPSPTRLIINSAFNGAEVVLRFVPYSAPDVE
jgi:hypothetical protein